MQDDRFEVEVVGWGVGKESWGIRYQKIFGDLLKEQVWADLDAFLLAGFQKKDGTVLHILSACMDSGGHFPDQVLRFTRDRWERKVWAIKGKGGSDVPFIRNPTTNNRVKAPLFTLGVDAGKALLYTDADKDIDIVCSVGGGTHTKSVNRRATSVYDASLQLVAELNNANHGTVKLKFGWTGIGR